VQIEGPSGADWVLISDESPLDEQRRDELLESFQIQQTPGGLEHEDELEEEFDEDELEVGEE